MPLLSKYSSTVDRCDVKSDLGLRGDGAGGDPDGVDASIGVFVDLNIGLLFPGLEVPRRVEQVQHLLVVQLESRWDELKEQGAAKG